MNNSKINFDIINFTRFLCAFLIVAIHTLPSNTYLGYLIIITARIAVPFFFLCSGYFLTNKLYIDQTTIKKGNINNYLKNIFSIYLTWSLIYLVVRLANNAMLDIPLVEPLALIKDFLFIGIWGHLWYLSALIFSVYLLHILINKLKLKFKYVLGLSLILYLFVLTGDAYYGLFTNTAWESLMIRYILTFGEVWNSFAAGLIFIVLGIGIKKYDLVTKINKPLLFTTVLYIAYLVEHLLLKVLSIPRDNTSSIMLLLLAPILFISLLKLESAISINAIKKHSKFYKDSSLTIYLVHPLVILIISNLFNALGMTEGQYLFYLKFIVTAIISLAIALLSYKYKSSYPQPRLSKQTSQS